MSRTEPELRLREQRVARREQLLRAREAELSAERCSADRLDALVREFVDRTPRARLEPAPGVLPGALGLWLLASPVVLGFGRAARRGRASRAALSSPSPPASGCPAPSTRRSPGRSSRRAP